MAMNATSELWSGDETVEILLPAPEEAVWPLEALSATDADEDIVRVVAEQAAARRAAAHGARSQSGLRRLLKFLDR